MSAIEKTKRHGRKFVPIDNLEANPDNPNEMNEAEFNLLYDNVEKMGLTDPIFVVPHPKPEKKKKKMYMIIGGEHRWEVAKLHGFEEVPVTIVDEKDFNKDEQKFQMVRHNIIHGNMSPQKFMSLYQSLTKEYTKEVAAEMFGFANEEEFTRLIKETKASLPKELHGEFDAAKSELKTIDDLSALLNKLFSQHGDTLPFGYMIFDFGGQDSVWLRLQKSDLKNFNVLADACKSSGKTLDSVVSGLLQLIANEDEELEAILEVVIENAPDVDMSMLGDGTPPTLDMLNGN